jgi:hypothetical protein
LISGGMQKRPGPTRAMSLDSEILFFGELSAGLDPISARLLDDLAMAAFRREGEGSSGLRLFRFPQQGLHASASNRSVRIGLTSNVRFARRSHLAA